MISFLKVADVVVSTVGVEEAPGAPQEGVVAESELTPHHLEQVPIRRSRSMTRDYPEKMPHFASPAAYMN